MKHLLSSTAFLVVNKQLTREIGLKAAVLLADLISKENYFEERGTLKDGWFFNSAENIQADTTLTRYDQDKAIKKLEGLGVIETKLKGLPAIKHYKIFANKIASLLQTGLEKSQEVDVKEVTSNKNNLIIKIKKKDITLRALEFEENVFQVSNVSEDIIKDFVSYWTEPNKSKTKMRFERQATWDTNRRLQTWCRNEKKWDRKPQGKVTKNMDTLKRVEDRLRNL
jgi:hypothetical protein